MDREKAIKGLEDAQVVLTRAVDRGGEMAVMGAFNCLNNVTRAIALLKEQEARILKPEEFAGTYSYCWLETKASDGRTVCVISDICVADDGVNYEARFVGTSDRGKLPHDWLGSRWRCWSAEPTDEQRKEAAWD